MVRLNTVGATKCDFGNFKTIPINFLIVHIKIVFIRKSNFSPLSAKSLTQNQIECFSECAGARARVYECMCWHVSVHTNVLCTVKSFLA